MDKILFYKSIRLFRYIYLNYFSKNVERRGQGKIIPYKNAIIDLEPNSKIILYDKELEIGSNKLRYSKAETYIRLRKNAIWEVKNGASISYGATIEVLYDAVLDTCFFTMNSFSVIICAKNIVIGDDVMIGRNVTVYDSDFHKIQNNLKEVSQKVYIGNHVWLTSHVTILKGVTISDGCIVGNHTVINKNIEANQLVTSNIAQVVRREKIEWRK